MASAFPAFISFLMLQENVNKELHYKINSLTREVDLLKQGMDTQQQSTFPSLPLPGSQMQRQWGEQGAVINNNHTNQLNSDGERRSMCSAARKVVGFTPIEPRMLEIQMESYGAKDMAEAMEMEVKSYLKCEMKVPPSIIENFNFVRIFPPAKEDWNVLYVEFGSDQEIDKVFSYTRRMIKKDHRVVRWTPRQMFDRFSAIQIF